MTPFLAFLGVFSNFYTISVKAFFVLISVTFFSFEKLPTKYKNLSIAQKLLIYVSFDGFL